MASIAKHIPVNPGVAKSWSNLNGTGTIAENDSFNISSYTDIMTGQYTFTLSSAMSDANYGASLAVSDDATNNRGINQQGTATQHKTSSAFRVSIFAPGAAVPDSTAVYFLSLGDLA